MVIAIIVAISLLDIAFHRIPNKLLMALLISSYPSLHLNLVALLIATSLLAVPSLGAGDLKYSAIGAIITPHFNFQVTVIILTIALALSLIFWRREGSVPLAPAISALLIANM